MIKNLIKIGLLLVAGILVYNYFYGTDEEREQSRQFFQEVKELGAAAWSLLKSEKAKLDEGKYDEALSNIGDLFEALRAQAEAGGQAVERIGELERERRALEDRLSRLNEDQQAPGRSGADRERDQESERRLKDDIKQLFNRTERLMEDMEQQQ